MSILFNDLDSDGDYDLYLASGSHWTDGAVVINNGNFDFTMIKPDDRPSPKSLGLYKKLDNSSIVMPKKVLTKEEQLKKDKLAADAPRIKAEKAAEIKAGKAKRLAEIEVERAKIAAARAKRIAEEERLAEENKNSPLFDGRYSFNLLRYHDDEDCQELGNGYIEINNGIMTIAKEGRNLDTDSTDLYYSFMGQINKKGNIISTLKINVLFGKTSLFLVDLNGSIESPLQGKWDHYYDVILKLVKIE